MLAKKWNYKSPATHLYYYESSIYSDVFYANIANFLFNRLNRNDEEKSKPSSQPSTRKSSSIPDSSDEGSPKKSKETEKKFAEKVCKIPFQKLRLLLVNILQ